jgi:hypothetical protein
MFLVCGISAAGSGTSADISESEAGTRIFDNTTYLNANSVFMFFTNTGLYSRDIDGVFGYEYGMFYPYTSIADIENGTNSKSLLYSAGIWLGGLVNGQLRVSLAEFGSEFWPGPMAGSTYVADADTIAAYRMYKLYRDSMSTNPNTDYLEWPDSLGAPVDHHGDPRLSGDQMLWAVFNDANPARHTLNDGSTEPLGIEVRQLSWEGTSWVFDRIIYVEYKLYNRGPNEITDFYIGVFDDPDLGWIDDDLFGCDTLANEFFVYNADNEDNFYGTAPPAFGVKLLCGPLVPSSGDTARFGDSKIPDYRNLPMTSYVRYVNGTDPQNPQEVYNLLQGLSQDGSPLPNGTRYSFPGDPIAGTGDLDPFGGNKHCVMGMGPFDFHPGDSQYVLIKIAVGHGLDNIGSLANLRYVLAYPNNYPTDAPDEGGEELPDRFSLSQNYPNPFNPTTVIKFSLPTRSEVSLEVFNVLGQKVKSLVNGELPAGEHSVTWDGTDRSGNREPSGVYFYRLKAGNYVQSRKMVLVR